MKNLGPTRSVSIVLDPACGWSFIGYTRFARAAARRRSEGGAVAVTFRPYQIDPDAPAVGEPLLDVLRRRFGPGAALDTKEFTALAAREGVVLDYARAVHSNTFEAHRLIATAARQGLAERVVDRLFHAHYSHGLDIGDPGTLADLAAGCGVGTGNQATASEIRTALTHVRASGVRSVPVFRFEGGPELVGAQQQGTLLTALRAQTRPVGRP